MVDAHALIRFDDVRLASPRIRPASVEKSAAISRLVGSSTPFATIIAPAGYGKSTLLAQWAAVDPRPFAWVALDMRDDDAIVFLQDIAAAMERLEPLMPSTLDALTGPGDTIWTRVPHLANQLAALERRFVLVLDDLHAVTNPACLDLLATLYHYIPPGSQIVIASRAVPDMPLARWRAQGMLVEIGTADLRLDEIEAGLLLQGAGVTLTGSQIAELTDRTEGWPAGLYLAALSLRAGPADATNVEQFTGDDRYIAEYVRLEVLSRLPEPVARFLVRTSMLDRLSGSLCDAVLETHGSVSLLGSIERSNRFVIALDNQSVWFRYHHLFRQLLRNELDRTEPETVRVLNRRAMDWSIAHGDLEAAVRYGHDAGESEHVAELIERLVWPLYHAGRVETLREWLGWFGNDELDRFPALAILATWMRLLSGRGDEAEKVFAIAEGSKTAMPLAPGSPAIRPWVALMRALMMPDGVEAAIGDADLAISELAPGDLLRPSPLLYRGVAHVLLGSAELGRADLLASVDAGLALGSQDDIVLAYAELALLDASQRSWAEAARHAREARARVKGARLDGFPGTALAHVAVARVALHDRRQAEARAAMTNAHRLRPLLDHGVPWMTLQVGIELTRGHLALGETEAARSLLDETTSILRRRPGMGSLVDDVSELRARVEVRSETGNGLAVTLTAAELRLLPYLATHLTFPEIADHLFVTSHTVRSQAKTIYRKLDVSSRSEAIDWAVRAGLLEPTFPHRVTVAA